MKKMLSMLLAASMLLAIAPMAVSAYEEDKIESIEADLKKSDNLAYGKTVIRPDNALDQGDGGAWRPVYLTDGTLNYNSSTHETTGYHSQHNAFGGNADKNHEEWVGVDFGAETEVDTLVLYPNRPQDSDFSGTDGKCPSFPNAFPMCTVFPYMVRIFSTSMKSSNSSVSLSMAMTQPIIIHLVFSIITSFFEKGKRRNTSFRIGLKHIPKGGTYESV